MVTSTLTPCPGGLPSQPGRHPRKTKTWYVGSWLLVVPAVCGIIGCGSGDVEVDRSATQSHPIFAGECAHDFGEHDLGRTKVVLEYEFRLRNTSATEAVIADVKSTCGCAVATVKPRIVPAGEEVEVLVTLGLTKAGRRSERVALVLEDGPPLMLRVSATARLVVDLRASRQVIDLRKEGEASIVLTLIARDDVEEPHFPLIRAPSWVESEFLGWQLIHPADERHGWASRWHGVLRVACAPRSEAANQGDEEMTIEVRSLGRLKVNLTGWPWF